MARNELLRTIREALILDDAAVQEVFRCAGREFGPSTVAAFLASEEQDGYIPCSDPVLGFFLDGLIIHRRGQRDDRPAPSETPPVALTNNAILKKLRIAMDLKEDDLIAVYLAAGFGISKHDLTALFRKPGHKHYRECSERLLTDFIRGLAARRQE